MMIQLILDSRNLLEPGPAKAGTLHGQMEAVGICGSRTADSPARENVGEAARQINGTASAKPCNTEAGPQAAPVCSKGSGEGQEHDAAFARRIGVIFSAMYNVFVDAEVLQTIQDVAERLATWITSSEEWSSTEIGRMIHFADDRGQDRVRDILALYADKKLQTEASTASVRRQRSADRAKRMSQGSTILSGSMGLASLRRGSLTLEAYNELAQKCKARVSVTARYMGFDESR